MSRGIAQHLATMGEQEQRFLQQRKQAAESSEASLQLLGALGIPLSLVILVCIFVLLSREVRERARA